MGFMTLRHDDSRRGFGEREVFIAEDGYAWERSRHGGTALRFPHDGGTATTGDGEMAPAPPDVRRAWRARRRQLAADLRRAGY